MKLVRLQVQEETLYEGKPEFQALKSLFFITKVFKAESPSWNDQFL